MQSDGNFVVYKADGTTPVWSTKTNTPYSYAVLHPRGVLVLYNASGQSLWTSGSQSRPDYNGDGYTDVVTRDANGELWIYPGTGGSGTGTLGTRYFAGNGWWRDHWTRLHTADLNNDGYTDIVARNHLGDLYLYPGTGRTGTETLGNPVLIGTGWNAYDLGFGDMNGDGRTDVIGRDGSGNLWVYPHQGGTGTQSLGSRFSIGVGWGAADWTTLRFADLDNDHRTDVLAHRNDGKLYLYPNTGKGGSSTLDSPSVVGVAWWNNEWTPYAADLNSDGAAEQVGLTKTGELYDFVGSDRFLIGTGWVTYDVVL
ncbi:FG-GAP-like repeat-containing protein [Streptomyces toxytricini]|uniref:FG-GAP-like repeat-containing protein n=1 Tax=Streptomyces toxytricini TaxID=67369 RepID=A0ABW8EGK6_STRT5